MFNSKIGSKWTDEIDEAMRVNWIAGTSATDCVAIIYARFGVMFTRNAIIGHARDKGYKTPTLGGYPGPPKDPNKPKPETKYLRRRKIAQQFGVPIPLLKPAFKPMNIPKDAPKSLNVTLLKLPPRCCRYPTSPDDAETHLFCGHPQQEGIPYCRHHARIAYRATARQVENDGVRV